MINILTFIGFQIKIKDLHDNLSESNYAYVFEILKSDLSIIIDKGDKNEKYKKIRDKYQEESFEMVNDFLNNLKKCHNEIYNSYICKQMSKTLNEYNANINGMTSSSSSLYDNVLIMYAKYESDCLASLLQIPKRFYDVSIVTSINNRDAS